MMLVGVSGKDPEQIMEQIRRNQRSKQFAPLCPIHRRPIREAASVVRERHAFSMDITVPKLAVACKLAPCVDALERLRREWCIRLAQDLCFSSLNPQYQRWLDEGIISDFVGADVDLGADHGVLLFYTETQKTAAFEALVDDVCKQMAALTVDEEALQSLKHRYFGSAVRSLGSFDDIAIGYIRSAFAGYDYFAGMDIIDAIRAEDIREVCRSLDLTHRSVVVITPKR